MKSTNKHGREPGKTAFKTPAQELQGFKAKVLALEHGPAIWMALTMEESGDDPHLLSEWAETVLAPFPAMLAQHFPNGVADREMGRPLADRLFRHAMREVGSNVDELWPEYMRLLERNPEELKAYRERYKPNRLPPDFAVRPRELRKGPGRTRTNATRDEQIREMHVSQKRTFGQIARKLGISRPVAIAACRREKKRREG